MRGNIITCKDSGGYIVMKLLLDNKKYNLLCHHFAWYCVNGNCDTNEIDHINGVRDDNRICNLRNVNHTQNQWNRTKARGYTWNKPLNKWQSKITLNDKSIHLGYFTTEEEARQVYLKAKEKYHTI